MKVIYIAGPYTGGDVARNVKRAIYCGMAIYHIGHYAIIPHLTHFVHMLHPRKYDFWIDVDKRILPTCDALLRIKGDSPGADREVLIAQSLGKPIFYTLAKLLIALQNERV
jgi:hypothetical protein